MAVVDQRRFLRGWSRARVPDARRIRRRPGRVERRRLVERHRLELGAESLLGEQAPVAEVGRQRQRFAGNVRAAKQVGVVLAGVEAPGRAVAIAEATRRDRHVQATAGEIGQPNRQVRLVDPQVGGQLAITGVGDVLRRDLHRGLDARGPDMEIELGPGRHQAAGVTPVGGGRVGHQRRRAHLRAGVAAVGVGRGRRAPRPAQRRAQVAAHPHLPRASVGRRSDRQLAGSRRQHEAAVLGQAWIQRE